MTVASSPDAPRFERVAVIGCGLIGSSIARAVRKSAAAQAVAICDADPDVIDRARDLGLGDDYALDPARAVRGADLVILCVPMGAFASVAEAMAPGLSPDCIVSDTGSTKQSVIRDLAPILPDGVHLVPGHPVAGTEHSGPDAGFAELFEGRWCILTPPPGADPGAVARLTAFWTRLGSAVEMMDANHHDKVLAITSHLPHLIAYTIVGTATDLEDDIKSEVIRFSAGGFRDFTRIAASDPVMWRDVFLANKEAVLEMLQRFSEDLTALQRAIRWGEGEVLFDLFSRTRAIRRGVIEAKQE